MQIAVEQWPEYARIWSLVLFGIGIAALLFAYRRTISYQRRMKHQPASPRDQQALDQARALIDDIEVRTLYEKRQRAIMFTRCSTLNLEQRQQLNRVTTLQSRRRCP